MPSGKTGGYFECNTMVFVKSNEKMHWNILLNLTKHGAPFVIIYVIPKNYINAQQQPNPYEVDTFTQKKKK